MAEPHQSPVRERILDAAMSLLRDAKTKKIAQPQVARLAGVPQGHLTYYFPKKLDLMVAIGKRYAQVIRRELAWLLEGPVWQERDEESRQEVLGHISRFVTDRERTRMLLRLLVEADADPAVGVVQATSAEFVRSSLARLMDRDVHDPDVDIALAIFWGLGLQHLVFDRSDEESQAVLARMRQWMDIAWVRKPADPT